RVYTETKKGVSFAAQCRHLTLWRQSNAGLASLNAQSEQVTLKRRHLAFQAFFRRVKNGGDAGLPPLQTPLPLSRLGFPDSSSPAPSCLRIPTQSCH
ncbi:MAG TPA: hypothetical protein VMV40_10665, partial [Acidiferrobacter sp.]|nr:hypothetical protein [Acidiferrobacter sp.]